MLICDENHRYWKDGVELPGVTSMLYRLGLTGQYPNRPEIRRRGTAVHDATLLYDQGALEGVGSAVEPYLAEYCRFVELYKPQYILRETVLYHAELMYAGRLDGFAIINGQEWLPDLKTSDWSVDKATDLQTMLYTMLVRPKRADAVKVKRAAVRLSGNGSGPQITMFEDNEAAYDAAVGAVNLYRWVVTKNVKVRAVA